MGELFINPWLLGGLALASSPIIIHLLNKRRFQVHDWAAMDFLLQAVVSNRRRLKFQDLLLLLMRVALIMLLVFTVARPVLRGFGGWSEDERIIVLDDSFSMDAMAPTTGSVFETARESAVNQVQDAIGRGIPVSVRQGSLPDSVDLLVDTLDEEMSDANDGDSSSSRNGESRSVLATGSEVLESLRELEIRDLPFAFGRTVERLLEAAEADKAPQFRRVVVVSDFRKRDWLGADGELSEPADAAFELLREREFTDKFGFQFVDVGHADADNTAVVDFRVATSHALSGVPVEFAVEVKNFGDATRTRVEGEVEIGQPDGGEFRALYKVPLRPFESIAPGESAAVEVEYTFERAGQYLLRVILDRDQLACDDESYCVVTVRDTIDVVLVDGDPGRDRFTSESGFLEAALSPRGGITTGLRPRVIIGDITRDAVEGADVILVLNRREVASSEWDVLERRVRDGAGLAFFLGSRVEPAGYKPDVAGAAASRAALFPVKLGEPKSERTPLALGGYEHPALEVFRGIDGASVEQVKFSRFFELEPISGATVVGRYSEKQDDPDDGTPAIVETIFEKGRVAVFNTSADRDWSDWPTDPSYVIILQEWVRYLAPRIDAAHNLEVGEPITWRVTPGKRYEIFAPGARRAGGVVRHEIDGGDDELASELSFAGTGRAGFYKLVETDTASTDTNPTPTSSTDTTPTPTPTDGGSTSSALPGISAPDEKITWYACRRGAPESDLAPIGETKLRSLLDDSEIKFSFGREVDVDAFEAEQEGELWRWLAFAAGLILLAELFLAYWFGRQ